MSTEKKPCHCWSCRRTSYSNKSKTLKQKTTPHLYDDKFRSNYRSIPKVLAKDLHRLFN